MAGRRSSKAETAAVNDRTPRPAVAAPDDPAQDRAALIALVRALARDAARADHAADGNALPGTPG